MSTEVRTMSAGVSRQVTIARPADTTAYAAGDVVGATAAAIEFQRMGATNGDHIRITDVDLRMDVASVPAGMDAFKLHLYSVTPLSALADNAAWDLPSGDRASYLGFIDITVPVDLGSTLFVQIKDINKKIQLGASNSLFGYLQTVAGFTPGSADVMAIRINAIRV